MELLEDGKKMLDVKMEAPAGFMLVSGGHGWIEIATKKMYGPGQKVAKLVCKDGKWALELFKGRPVSIANLRILQPWVDDLNV
jgi:hypothetical protein